MGVAWSLVTPLLLLAAYTFVFSVAFKARWGYEGDSKIAFATVLFCGMIVFNLFAECVNRAPGLVLANPNYVKKVVFPLEVLAWVAIASALLHFAISFALLVVFCVLTGQPVSLTALWAPVVLMPLVVFTMGLAWVLAALGVYLRDLAHGVSIVTTVLMFLSPVFYPIDALPPEYRGIMEWNPLARPIDEMRQVVLWGGSPDLATWGVQMVAALLVFAAGFWWFQRSRKGFADVI